MKCCQKFYFRAARPPALPSRKHRYRAAAAGSLAFRPPSPVPEFCIETQLHRRAKRLCSSCITRGRRLFLGNCWKFNEAACPRTIFSQPRRFRAQLCTRILKLRVRSSVISAPRHGKYAEKWNCLLGRRCAPGGLLYSVSGLKNRRKIRNSDE